eukprot:Em0004g1218a
MRCQEGGEEDDPPLVPRLAPPSSSQSYLHPHLHYPSSTLILTILPPPSSSQSYLHLHPTSTLIFTILPPPSSSQSYLHPHLPHTDHKKTDFLKEIDMMKLVAEGNIIHVVSFVGCVTVQEPLCLNTEFVRHGDLLAYLQNIRRMGSPLGEEAISPEMEGSGSVISDPTNPYADLGEVQPHLLCVIAVALFVD